VEALAVSGTQGALSRIRERDDDGAHRIDSLSPSRCRPQSFAGSSN
jgi:hypothetical protein